MVHPSSMISEKKKKKKAFTGLCIFRCVQARKIQDVINMKKWMESRTKHKVLPVMTLLSALGVWRLSEIAHGRQHAHSHVIHWFSWGPSA